MKERIAIFWLRRDLRLDDNTGLQELLLRYENVQLLFIYDKFILDTLDDKADARVTFIYQQLVRVKAALNEMGKTLWTIHDTPLEAFQYLSAKYHIEAIYANEDYEPYAIQRDKEWKEWCKSQLIDAQLFKDQVLFAKNEIVKNDGSPYTVFTPYAKSWMKAMKELPFIYQKTALPTFKLRNDNYHDNHWLELNEIGFSLSHIHIPPFILDKQVISDYEDMRDFPFEVNGTNFVGVHLRFGTVSIRQLIHDTQYLSTVYLKELIWREFFMMILYHFPKSVHYSFKPKYDYIEWSHSEADYHRWCAGMTGYPLVDAGMRQLNATGWMHNRVRMVCASFLVKHLLIDWRWGEAYFAKKLLDYDQAANVGNWQWAAGSGCDAAPYFRIFNPTIQLEKFDKERKYVSRWIQELRTDQYPSPMVIHEEARDRCLRVYKKALDTI